MNVLAATVMPLPAELSFSTGAAISCGIGTASVALMCLGVNARDTVAIFGQGPVGLSATQLARALGARAIAIEVSAERAARATALDADHAIDASTTDPVVAIRERTDGKGVGRASTRRAPPLPAVLQRCEPLQPGASSASGARAARSRSMSARTSSASS